MRLPSKVLAGISAAALGMSLLGCSSGGSSSETSEPPASEPAASEPAASSEAPAADDLILVGFVQTAAESGWRAAHTTDVNNYFTAENGFELLFADGQGKQENQIKLIRDYIEQGVDVIILAPLAATGWDEVLGEAKDAGIPVILSDRGIEVSDKSLYYALASSDFILEGNMAADWVNQNVPDAKVFELQGTLGSDAQIGRQEGFDDALTSGEILDHQTGDFTRDGGKKVIEAALTANPDMNVIYAHNDDMGLGAIEALEAAGKKPGEDVKIITIDGTSAALQELVDKRFNLVIECSPLLAETLGKLAKDAVAGEPAPEGQWVVTADQVFDQSITQEFVDSRPY